MRTLLITISLSALPVTAAEVGGPLAGREFVAISSLLFGASRASLPGRGLSD